MSDPQSSRRLRLCLGYVVLHVVAHFSASWFEVTPGVTVSIWYPPVGLALALMTLLGPRAAPLVFATNLATAWVGADPFVAWAWVFFPAMITVCYGAAAWLARRATGPLLLPGDARRTRVFCLTMGLAPLAPALIATAVVDASGLAGGPLAREAYWRSVFEWWLGDLSGLLVVVPAAMVYAAPWLEGRRPWRRARRGLAERGMPVVRGLTLLAALSAVVSVPVLREHNAFYLCFLPLIWICATHGLRGATLATLLTMLVGLAGMRLTGVTREFSYIFLLFELAVAVVGLGLGALVSRRNEAERELAESRAQLDRVIAGARLGLWERDMETGRMTVNARVAEMVGRSPEELEPAGELLPELLHPEDRRAAGESFLAHVQGRAELFEVECRLRAKDGRWRWVSSRGSVVVRDEEGRPLRMAGVQIDVTDRRRAEEQAARMSRIVAASPDFIFTLNADGRVLHANPALLALLGRAGGAERRPFLEDWFGGEEIARWRAEAMPAARARGAWQGEGELTAAGGRRIPVSEVVVARLDAEEDGPIFSFILRDISDQRRAEEERLRREHELLQLQKSESLGVLAGGIAHDFNNLLTAILGNANLARFGLSPVSPTLPHLDNIEQAARRAAGLCQQMLAYAGRAPVAFTELDLNRLLGDVWRLLGSSVSPKVKVRFELGRGLPPVLAAAAQMQQVAMNLILNAAEAIGDREGAVTVRTREASLGPDGEPGLFAGRPGPAGQHVVLEVQDDGPGMAPEVLARIFEPFYTTKFTGHGLGLAAVAGVVKSHRGRIEVRSAPGEGALFRLAFPAVAAAPAVVVEPEAGPGPAGGGGLVLLVDDDALIREVGAGILRALGHSVVTARDGAEGVERFREHAGRLGAVLLDLTMPRMDGLTAHAEMHRLDPAVPVVLMSGFSSRLENLPPEAIRPAAVLSKPFGMDQLRDRLDAVMKK